MTHLTLEQCIDLKKRGAPQDTYSAYSESWGPDKINWPDFTKRELKKLNIVACPTLDELIVWLGDKFQDLYFDPRGEGYKCYSWSGDDTTTFATPLEAIYALEIASKPVIEEK